MAPCHFKMAPQLTTFSRSARKLVSSVNFRRKIIGFQVGKKTLRSTHILINKFRDSIIRCLPEVISLVVATPTNLRGLVHMKDTNRQRFHSICYKDSKD